MLSDYKFSSLLTILFLLEGAFANSAPEEFKVVRDAVVVTTPGELRHAVHSRRKHIIINDHIDLTTPEDAGVLSIYWNAAGEHTLSIRVRTSTRSGLVISRE